MNVLFKFAQANPCRDSVLIKCPSTPLAFPCPSPANSATFKVPHVSIIENQGCIVSFITIIFSGNTDAGTSLQGCKKRTCHTIDEPHSYPIKLSTPRWRAMTGCGTDPWLNRIWTQTEEARAIRGGSCSHELKDLVDSGREVRYRSLRLYLKDSRGMVLMLLIITRQFPKIAPVDLWNYEVCPRKQ